MSHVKKYLAINTASDLLTVTLADDAGHILDEINKEARQNHATELMPALTKILPSDKTELGGIICAIGPGSFTGIRIGLSAANALAYGYDIPIAGVSNLDLLAAYALDFYHDPDVSGFESKHKAQLEKIDDMISIIDAGRDEVYVARYSLTKGNKSSLFTSWKRQGEFDLVALSEKKDSQFPPLQYFLQKPALVVGTLKSKYFDNLTPLYHAEHLFLLYFDRQVSVGKQLISLGIQKFKNKNSFKDGGQISPLYIREAHVTKSKKITLTNG